MVAPSLAVFRSASAFNQDVSKWNTGAVTDMSSSKCTLSPSLWPRLSLLCILIYDNSSFIGSQFSHVLLFLFLCFRNGTFFLLFVLGWSFFFFVAPSLAVFHEASVFNQDVSKWNTEAVRYMSSSKCTLSLPLPVATPSAVVCFEHTTTRSFIGSQFSHVLLFLFLCF